MTGTHVLDLVSLTCFPTRKPRQYNGSFRSLLFKLRQIVSARAAAYTQNGTTEILHSNMA